MTTKVLRYICSAVVMQVGERVVGGVIGECDLQRGARSVFDAQNGTRVRSLGTLDWTKDRGRRTALITSASQDPTLLSWL